MKIIKHRTHGTNVFYQRMYGTLNPSSIYFSFNCDEQGHVDETKLHSSAVDNFNQCKNGTKMVNGHKMEFLEVKRYEQDYVEPAEGICDVCERKVILDDAMTNTCDCGAEYNASGQRLEDRRLWDDTDGATSPDYE